jgi:hypothetical protein
MNNFENSDDLYASDYTVAVEAVTHYVNNNVNGVPRDVWEDFDKFARETSEKSLAALDGEVLFNASAWGALDESLTGTHTPDSVVFYERPDTEYEQEDMVPWIELLRDGDFSTATLQSEPTSFVAGGRSQWLDKIVASAESYGWTWLHHYHVALEAAERCVRNNSCFP